VAPLWIKAAQQAASSKKNGKAGPLDSYGTQATTASSVLSIVETGNSKKKIGSNASSSSSSTPLSKNLHTLSLARNRYLLTIPQKLVSGSMVSGAKLVNLKLLDLSSCAIQKLPDESKWDLPQLTTLNLAHNRLQDFPSQVCVLPPRLSLLSAPPSNNVFSACLLHLHTQNVLGGLPQLKELNLYGNRLSEICNIPQGCCSRSNNHNSKLVLLNVAYNDLVCLPETLAAFPRLESLIASHNFLAVIPQGIVLSSPKQQQQQHHRNSNNKTARLPRLRHLDITSNPVTEPPVEVCEAGLHEMRRYYKAHPQQQDSSKRGNTCCPARTSRRSSSMTTTLMHTSRDFDKQQRSAADAIRVSHENDDCLGGGQEEPPQDADAMFRQQLQQHSSSQQQQQGGLLSRRRPSHEVPLYISVASTVTKT
jgi:Leucine rich repeat